MWTFGLHCKRSPSWHHGQHLKWSISWPASDTIDGMTSWPACDAIDGMTSWPASDAIDVMTSWPACDAINTLLNAAHSHYDWQASASPQAADCWARPLRVCGHQQWSTCNGKSHFTITITQFILRAFRDHFIVVCEIHPLMLSIRSTSLAHRCWVCVTSSYSTQLLLQWHKIVTATKVRTLVNSVCFVSTGKCCAFTLHVYSTVDNACDLLVLRSACKINCTFTNFVAMFNECKLLIESKNRLSASILVPNSQSISTNVINYSNPMLKQSRFFCIQCTRLYKSRYLCCSQHRTLMLVV